MLFCLILLNKSFIYFAIFVSLSTFIDNVSCQRCDAGWYCTGDGLSRPCGRCDPPMDNSTCGRNPVEHSFGGDIDAAQEKTRLFMVPGLGHCDGGPGIDRDNDFAPHGWDRLQAIQNWVENGEAPDHLVIDHYVNGEAVGTRRVCPYPQRAVYSGPEGGQSDYANWVESNYVCRQ